RKVMEQLPHVMLVGAGAARFARELGFPAVELLTEEARRIWEEQGRSAHLDTDDAIRRYLTEMRKWAGKGADPEKPNETVNFIARDRDGNLACGVSTSGWEWKYPGRLGDSPVIGAGNYADNRWGAAACTGRGEMAIRGATAHSVVTALRYGRSLEDACREALLDLDRQRDPFAGPFSLIAVDSEGRHHAASNRPDRTYVYLTAEMAEPQEAPRVYVAR
ncbi:MAG: isoaspartyl peptidase/L-asparaginase, partial [Chloroflexi bacterium]|nr:isoaspartyl peptidase/L-asparaginase [Chloroflexota bacterium]